jgi:hypothetical protein
MIGEFKKVNIKKEINPTLRYQPLIFKVCLLIEFAVIGTYINNTIQECKQIICSSTRLTAAVTEHVLVSHVLNSIYRIA